MSEGYNFEGALNHATWAIDTDGSYFNLSNTDSDRRTCGYCLQFGDGVKITVHLDMNRRTLAFTVNGKKCPE